MAIRIEHGGAGTSPAAGQLLAATGQQELTRQQQQRQFDVSTVEGAVSREQRESQFERGLTQQRGLQASQAIDQAARLAEQLSSRRDAQMQQIDAQADLQRQSADEAAAKMALEFGLEGQIKEQEFDRTMKEKQEEARLQANQWDVQFSAKQRQDIARNNQAKQAVATALRRGEISPEEAQAMSLKIDMETAGIEPSMVPAAADRWTGAEEEGPGMVFRNKAGGYDYRNKEGEARLHTKYEETPEGIEAAEKAKLQATEVVRQQTIADAELKRSQTEADNRAKAILEEMNREVSTGVIGDDGKMGTTTVGYEQAVKNVNQAYGVGRQQEIEQQQVEQQVEQIIQQQLQRQGGSVFYMPRQNSKKWYDEQDPGTIFIRDGKQYMKPLR